MAIVVKTRMQIDLIDNSAGIVLASSDRRITDAPASTTISGGEKYEVRTVIADDYTRLILWQNGDGGLDTFAFLLLETDVDVLVELAIDRAGTPTYSVQTVTSATPLILGSDDQLNAVLTNGSGSSMDQIDQIAAKRNVADAGTNANVHLLIAG